eukprot:3214985-Rhodomonas_salina.2
MPNLKTAPETGVIALGGFEAHPVGDRVWSTSDTSNVHLLLNAWSTVFPRPFKKLIHSRNERCLLTVRDRAAGNDGIPCMLATQRACRRADIQAIVEPQTVVIVKTSADERVVQCPRKKVAIKCTIEIVAMARGVASEKLTHPGEEI